MRVSPRIRLVASVIALGVAAPLVGCAAGSDGVAGGPATTTDTSAPPAAAESAEPSYFFSQTARSGTITGDPASAQLQLDDVAGITVAITERPNRGATHLTTSGFVDDWNSQFGDDPPNATVAVVGEDGLQYEAAVELLGPTYDESARRLTYSVRTLSGALPTRFTDASVMIDDAAIGVQLTVINRSSTPDAEFVLYMSNEASAGGPVVAWTVLDYTEASEQRSIEVGPMTVAASDSFGNTTPQLSAAAGSAFLVTPQDSGDSIVAMAPRAAKQITVTNGSSMGSPYVLSVDLFLSGRRLATVPGVQPTNTAVFEVGRHIWIGGAEGIVEGQVMQPGAPQDPAELSLENISSAELIITGGGSQPYSFTLSNTRP